MPDTSSLATIADYFRLGLETGLLKPDDAKAWALSVVERLPEPPYEIIELSWIEGLASTLEALATIKGERDTKLAGQWILGCLRESMPQSDEHLHWMARRAMQIAKTAGLGDETYYKFDSIDDALSLARSKTCGTVEECRNGLLDALEEYPMPPSFSAS